MNEPFYTTYAVPARWVHAGRLPADPPGRRYRDDQGNAPETQVIGTRARHWVQEFVDADGLQWCDAMDIHLYPVTIPPESYEEDLAESGRRCGSCAVKPKPIWLTEFGCYADDDPYKTPGEIGDSAMSRGELGVGAGGGRERWSRRRPSS